MECAIATDWIIDEKTLREIENRSFFETSHIETTIPDVQYFIRIYPNGEHEEDEDKVVVQACVECKVEVKADFTIVFMNYKLTYSESFDFQEPFCGRVMFPSNRFVLYRDHKLTLQLRGTLKCDYFSDTFDRIDGNYRGNLNELLWNDEEDKDFEIEVDGGIIKAHKIILRRRSPFFAAMFNSGMKEAIENKVKIEGFPFFIVKASIELCYDLHRWNRLIRSSFDKKLLSLKFSDLYDIPHIKERLEIKFAEKITVKNVCQYANASVEFNAKKLRLCCMNYLIKCLKSSTPTPGIDSLDNDFKAECFSKAMCHKI